MHRALTPLFHALIAVVSTGFLGCDNSPREPSPATGPDGGAPAIGKGDWFGNRIEGEDCEANIDCRKDDGLTCRLDEEAGRRRSLPVASHDETCDDERDCEGELRCLPLDRYEYSMTLLETHDHIGFSGLCGSPALLGPCDHGRYETGIDHGDCGGYQCYRGFFRQGTTEPIDELDPESQYGVCYYPTCWFDWECPEACRPELNLGESVCLPYGLAGEACAEDDDCVEPLGCLDDGTCG